jgi:hypothetical protein
VIRQDDIEAAISGGILTAEQGRALERLAHERRQSRVLALGREERFRLLGGFNDLFIAIGVVLLGVSLFTVQPLLIPVLWLLAELLTRRLKLVAPSIVIVLFLALQAGTLGARASEQLNVWALETNRSVDALATTGYGLGVLAMIGLHYARFRLPFSLFVIACALVTLVLAGVSLGLAPQLDKDALGTLRSWLAVGLGVLVFLAAMRFDVADPERTSRRADCGFWLHLLAAPLIVHPVASPLITHPVFGRSADVIAEPAIGLVVVLIGALAILALVVDRRALLVAGLAYLGAAMSYGLTKLAGDAGTILTLAAMGCMIIVLGIGWRQIRAALMSRLPDGAWKRGLPPYERSLPT